MAFLIILIIIEILTLAVFRQHFFIVSKIRYYIFVIFNTILSILLWVMFFKLAGHDSFYDSPDHVWLQMAFTGMLSAVVFPRFILIIIHFSGRIAKMRSGGHFRWLTNTGLIISSLIFIVIAISSFHGKLNFKYEEVSIEVKGLPASLEGLKIVHISDLHLAGFYHHRDVLPGVIQRINRYEPDLIINTGDFVTFGWREFGRNDTVLSNSKSRYGNFAIMGNHDVGTYHPEFTEADRKNNLRIMKNLVEASGYKVLMNEFSKVRIGEAQLAIVGVTTFGRHPDFVHGNLDEATAGLDSANLTILLTHDPNHWLEQVAGKRPGMQVTFSGHTHGMQMGIMTKKFRWSPSKYFYPNWNGLYLHDEQVHYVNRGLGVLAIPFRIWMPPEITIITLGSK